MSENKTSHQPLLRIDPNSGFYKTGQITLTNGIRCRWKVISGKYEITPISSSYIITPKDIGYVKKILENKLSSNPQSAEVKLAKLKNRSVTVNKVSVDDKPKPGYNKSGSAKDSSGNLYIWKEQDGKYNVSSLSMSKPITPEDIGRVKIAIEKKLKEQKKNHPSLDHTGNSNTPNSEYGVYITCHFCSKEFKGLYFTEKCNSCGNKDGYEGGRTDAGEYGVFCKICKTGRAGSQPCPKCRKQITMTCNNIRIVNPIDTASVIGWVIAIIIGGVIAIGLASDPGVDFKKGIEKATPDKMIIVPTNRGYRPAPVFDLND